MKLLWDTNEPRDHVMEAQNPGIIPGDKENKVCAIIDVAIPDNIRVGEKKKEKVEKYQDPLLTNLVCWIKPKVVLKLEKYLRFLLNSTGRL